MACFDSTVLVDLARGGGNPHRLAAERVLAELGRAGQALTTTRFNVAEMWVGVERSVNRTAEEARIAALLDEFIVLEFDADSARTFARLKANLHGLGRPVGDLDMLIASVALTFEEALVTRNLKHFANIRELKVITY